MSFWVNSLPSRHIQTNQSRNSLYLHFIKLRVPSTNTPSPTAIIFQQLLKNSYSIPTTIHIGITTTMHTQFFLFHLMVKLHKLQIYKRFLFQYYFLRFVLYRSRALPWYAVTVTHCDLDLLTLFHCCPLPACLY